jgi:hypothetical protein
MGITVKTGTREQEAEKSNDGLSGRRTYIVTVTSDIAKSDGVEFVVLDAPGIPEVGDLYATNVYVTSKRAEPLQSGDDGDWLVWSVEVTLGPPEEIDTGGGDPLDPSLPAPTFSYSTIQYERAIDKAYRDEDDEDDPTEPIENVVGDPFDPPLTTAYSTLSISITRSLRSFDLNKILQFQDTTNENSISIAGISVEPEQARMLQIGAQQAIDDAGEGYWQVSYQVEVSRNGFLKKVLNAGFNQIAIGFPGGKKPIVYGDFFDDPKDAGDDEKEPVDSPQKLTSSGDLITSGNEDEIYYIPFKVYFAKDWTTLDLPGDV